MTFYFRPKAAVLETLRCLVFLGLCRAGHLKPCFSSLSFALEVKRLLYIAIAGLKIGCIFFNSSIQQCFCLFILWLVHVGDFYPFTYSTYLLCSLELVYIVESQFLFSKFGLISLAFIKQLDKLHHMMFTKKLGYMIFFSTSSKSDF